MNGDNFRKVDGEAAAWALAQYFAAAPIPLDVCAPVSLVGDPKPTRKFGDGLYQPTREHRLAISEALIKRSCQRLGFSREERDEYRLLVKSKGFSTDEAIRIVRANRERRA